MSLKESSNNNNLHFLQGGGDMGELIRSIDWTATPIGAPAHWPAALKQTVSMMLTTTFPVLICWGEDYIQLYNDAFRPINGESKHPQAMGGSAKDTYAEIWDTIGPMFKGVMNGQAVGFPNFMVPLDRNGYLEDCYFDFSYSPIRDEDGHIGGVLVICMETTEKVRAIERLNISRENLLNTVRQAPVGMCIVKGNPLMVEEINNLFLEIIGKKREQFTTTPYWEVNAEAAAIYSPITEKVLRTGETYRAHEHPVMLNRNGKTELVHVDFVYEPIKDVNGKADAIMIVAIDVTDKVESRKIVEDNSSGFQSLNKELAVINEEFLAANEEMVATNEELTSTNEELAAVNEELASTNDELKKAQNNLQRMNTYLVESESKLKEAIESTARSEKLFRSIVLNIPKSLIIVIDKEHRYITVEGDIMDRLGYNRKDYEGKHPTEVGSTERYEASKHLYDRVIAGETFSVERKAETGEDYLVHFIPLKNEYDEVEAGLIIALDITEVKQAEEKSAKLAAIIASSDDAIISKTLESVITSWNGSAERIFGYTADEIIGETIYKLIPPGREEEEPQIIARLKTGERVEHFETKRLNKNGKLIDVSVTISPVKDKQGNIIGVSKIARDITERIQDEARKNDFIGMVSHELKTPLTSLNGIIQVANAKLKNSDDAFLANAMEKANTQVKRMTVMINGFLNISRLEAGKILIDKQPFDLAQLLNEVLDETNLIVSTHTITLEECGHITINADRDKITSVVSNLVSNAVKYSPKGKLINIRCKVDAGKVIVSVKDEGMGIKPHDLRRIFDRYYRIESDHTRHISGFGIGLYLTAEIIKRHDGEIWAESESGLGSTFHFSLPME